MNSPSPSISGVLGDAGGGGTQVARITVACCSSETNKILLRLLRDARQVFADLCLSAVPISGLSAADSDQGLESGNPIVSCVQPEGAGQI